MDTVFPVPATIAKPPPPAGKIPAYRRLTNADRAYITSLAPHHTQAQIAQRLGCSQQAVSDWLQSCRDTTVDAKSYLRGQALRMAQNIVKKGRAQDHVSALKGLNVLDEEQRAGLVIQVGSSSDVKIALFTSALSPPLIHPA